VLEDILVIRRLAVSALLVIGLALICIAGVHNLRARREAIAKSQQNEVMLTKADAPPADGEGDPMARPMLGKVAPAFTLVDLKGKKVSLADFKGHAVVLNFWATYCGPCKLEMPWFESLEAKYQPQGLVVLGLDQDDGVGKDEVATAARKVGVSYPILMPDDHVAKDYQLGDYLPETIYVGADGKVVDETIGAHSKDELEADIQKAIAARGM
jgi:thiol-disulfide isomerase/thioredoxin